VLPHYAVVNGVVNTTGSTFQTGDTINGAAGDATTKLNINDAGNAGAAIAATVNGIGSINHTLLASNSYNEALYTAVGSENIVKSTGGNTLTLTNANAATTFGLSQGAVATADTLNVAFTAGGTKQKLQLNLGGTGKQTAQTAVNYTGAGSSELNAISIASTGNNFATLSAGASAGKVVTVTVAGAGNNVLNIQNAIATGTSTAPVLVDLTGAIGNNTVDFGTALTNGQYLTINGAATMPGSTAVTTVGFVMPAALTLPTLTGNVSALQLDAGQTVNGTLLGQGNTTITTVTDLGTGYTNTLNSLAGLNSLVFGFNGGSAGTTATSTNAITLSGSTGSTLAVTFANQGSSALATGTGLTVGALTLSGPATVTINTGAAVGATGATTFNGITSTSLSSLTITNASTGLTALGALTTVSAAATPAGVLSTLNLSGIAGTANFTVASNTGTSTGYQWANGAVITGAVKGTTIAFADAKATSASGSYTVNLSGSSNFNNGTALNGLTPTSQALVGNFTITSTDAATNSVYITTGAGNDVITVGAGASTIDAGAGVNVINLGTHAAAQVDTINSTGSAAVTTVSGLNATDVVAFATNSSTVNLGSHAALTTATGGVTVTGGITATVNNLVAGDIIALNGTTGQVLTMGTHTGATSILLAASTGTVTINGIVGDTITDASTATHTVAFGTHTTGATYNSSAMGGAASQTLTFTGLAGDTLNLSMGAANAYAVALGTHTTGVTANVAGTNALTIGGNIAADVINNGYTISGTATAGNIIITTGNSSTVNENVAAGKVAVGAGVINIIQNAGGTYYLGYSDLGTSATTNAVTATFTGASTAAQAMSLNKISNAVLSTAAVDTLTLVNSASSTAYQTITNIQAGDKLVIAEVTGAGTVTTVTANTDASLAAMVTRVGATAGTYVETIGSTTYVYANDGTSGAGTGDAVIALVGTHTLSQSTASAVTTMTILS
jgi:hypothetical protein